MQLETLKDLYIHELKDLHSAEKQLTKALPKMAKAATNESLADGFRLHLDQTEEHVNRLERILESHKESTRGPRVLSLWLSKIRSSRLTCSSVWSRCSLKPSARLSLVAAFAILGSALVSCFSAL